jgi:hypothetical protein
MTRETTRQPQCVAVHRALQYSCARACVAHQLLQNATHLAVGAAAAGVLSGPFIDKNRVINAARHGTIFIICLLSTTLRHYSTKKWTRRQCRRGRYFTAKKSFSLMPITFSVSGRR